MNRNSQDVLRIAMPSKGALEKGTSSFLAASGLKVSRPNDRQYVGSIPSLKGSLILFQRAADIFAKVEEGSADLGVTGYDIVCEEAEEFDDTIVVCDRLGYGDCELVLAVPDSWIDVNSIEDFAEIALLFRQKGKEVRIATKYTNLTRKWLYQKSIVHFTLVEAQGALEAAPSMGYADVIVDLTSTGTTLRENRLKRLQGGTMLESQACLIGNKRLLLESDRKLQATKQMLERLEAQMTAKKFISITANVRGNSAEEVGQAIADCTHNPQEKDLAGLRGPTVTKVYTPGESDWYAATIVVRQSMLLAAVDRLRRAGGTDITVLSPQYVFGSNSNLYETFLQRLKGSSA